MSTTPRHYTAQAQPADALPGRFRTLQYQPTPGEHWYHVLFGHVPRFQMDFIIRPELPCRKFRPQHFAHLGPQIKFLSPAAGLQYAVAIGNLSSNDTQHVAGRGGLSLLVSTRVADLRDHAQRESPVFAHSIIAIDESLTVGSFSLTVVAFVERVLDAGLSFYRSYYTSGQADNFERIYNYVRSLRDLPDPGDAADAAEVTPYSSDRPPPYNQILVDCRRVDTTEVLRLAARLGVILYQTNLKWTTITTGSEEFEPKIYQGEDYSIAVRLICSGVSFEDAERQAQSIASGSRIMACSFAELALSDVALGAYLFGLPGMIDAVPLWTASSASASALATQLPARSENPLYDRSAKAQLPIARRSSVSNIPLAGAVAAQPQLVQMLPGVLPQHAAAPPADEPRPRGRIVPAALGGLVGLVLGAAGVWLLLPAGFQGRHKASRPAPIKAVTDGRAASGASSELPSVPVAVPLNDPATHIEPELTARRMLAESVSDQVKAIAHYASTIQKRAKHVRATHDSGPWRRLQAESEQLQRQLQKMNHVAAALTEPGSVHNPGSLFETYCQVLSTYKAVQQLESSHQLDRGPNP